MASHRGPRLGSLPVRSLGLRRLVWLDLGQLRPLGLGPLSLRTLVPRRLRMGLVPRSDHLAPLLVARAGRFLRVWKWWVWCRVRFWQRGLVSPGAVRGLPPLVGTWLLWQSRLQPFDEYYQCKCNQRIQKCSLQKWHQRGRGWRFPERTIQPCDAYLRRSGGRGGCHPRPDAVYRGLRQHAILRPRRDRGSAQQRELPCVHPSAAESGATR